MSCHESLSCLGTVLSCDWLACDRLACPVIVVSCDCLVLFSSNPSPNLVSSTFLLSFFYLVSCCLGSSCVVTVRVRVRVRVRVSCVCGVLSCVLYCVV